MNEKDRLKTNNEKVTINDYYYYYLLKCEDALNELEKWCNECIDYNIISRKNGYTTISDEFFEIVLDKLKELKEDNKNV